MGSSNSGMVGLSADLLAMLCSFCLIRREGKPLLLYILRTYKHRGFHCHFLLALMASYVIALPRHCSAIRSSPPAALPLESR